VRARSLGQRIRLVTSHSKPGACWARDENDGCEAGFWQAKLRFDLGIAASLGCQADGCREWIGHDIHSTTIAGQAAHNGPETGNRVFADVGACREHQADDVDFQLARLLQFAVSGADDPWQAATVDASGEVDGFVKTRERP
jgi:hypothetical protein